MREIITKKIDIARDLDIEDQGQEIKKDIELLRKIVKMKERMRKIKERRKIMKKNVSISISMNVNATVMILKRAKTK